MTEIVTLPQPVLRLRFVWLLPALFAVGSGLAAIWPGHSGHLFFIGALAGAWACLLLDCTGEPSTWILPTLVGGVPILFFLGCLLDRLEPDPRLWLLAWLFVTTVAGYVLLQGYSDFEAAVDYHGSIWAYCVCALQLGGYGATLAVLAIGSGRGARW